jgi:hypothetical protein
MTIENAIALVFIFGVVAPIIIGSTLIDLFKILKDIREDKE